MGIADRDYHRDDRRGGSGFFSQMTPVVKWLLALNLAIYLLDLVLESLYGSKVLRSLGVFAIQSAIYEGRIWEFITFQFLHGNVIHLLFNCMGIFFFGPWLERWWGSLKFMAFYLACGIGGALFFTLLVFIGLLPGDGLQSGLVGASAGIYGILIGVAFIAPDIRVALLFPPVELSMRQMAMALLAFSVGIIFLGYVKIDFLGLGGNEGGEAGHLGGAAFGFLLMKFPQLLGGGGKAAPAAQRRRKPKPLPKLRPRSEIEKEQDTAVDRILDKISSHGFQSLTQEEKDLLHRVSNQKASSR
jgi:membrane associated rhomboid family serine protease